MKGSIRIPEYRSAGEWLVTARTYLVDRGLPKVERIFLPPAVFPQGDLTVSLSNSEEVAKSQNLRRRQKIAARIIGEKKAVSISENFIVDFRSHYPSNWSHSLNNHLPLAYCLKNMLAEFDPSIKFDLLFDEQVPNYIVDLFEYFGFSCLRYSGPVIGKFYNYELQPFASINAKGREILRDNVIENREHAELYEAPKNLPSKIFISRKDTRKLVNEHEVEEFLSAQGYTKIYAEDFTIQDQLRLFIHSTNIVAIHGAALAPLFFRPESAPTLNLVELFTAGHLSSHFRAMADQIDANWVGVRGYIEPGMIKSAYDYKKPFVNYSLSPFKVDIESLKTAFAIQSGSGIDLPS